MVSGAGGIVALRPGYGKDLMAFVDDVSAFDLFDDFGVVVVKRAAALVAFFDRCVKTSLFKVPLSDFQMLIYIHDFPFLLMLNP